MPERNPVWGYERQVVRRPEARGSEVVKAHIIHDWEEALALSAVVYASVGRRKAMSDEAMAEERDHMASSIGGLTDAEVREWIMGLAPVSPEGPQLPQPAAT